LGTIRKFDLARIIKEYKTTVFFETGTFRGDGVSYALQFPFRQIISVEIIPELASDAALKFSEDKIVRIIEGQSTDALRNELPFVQSNCVFWLDAHFPGADAGITAYDMENVETVRLPLIKELETIHALRPKFKDVFILDDLRIYEDGAYENGNVPVDALPRMERDIDFVYRYFSKTHFIFKCYLDEGYILMFPKGRYKRNHFRFRNLFRKRSSIEDLYLTGE
jgi:hypothetical protein